MANEQRDPQCPLYETQTCRQLNMRSCKVCPAHGADPRQVQDIRQDVSTLYGLLPKEGLHSLFAGEECTLCRGEQRGKRTCYGLYDMGHTDPRQEKKPTGLFRGKIQGFVVPLQFGCCQSCRRRFLLTAWAAPLCTILTLGLMLLWVMQEPVAQSLRVSFRGLPLVLLLVCGLVGYGAGKLLSRRLRSRFLKSTYMDLKDHPFVKAMMARGWESISADKYPRPLFARKRLLYGVGTGDLPEQTAMEGQITD